jgi:prevent-host-death family protein
MQAADDWVKDRDSIFRFWGLMHPPCPDPEPVAVDSGSMCYSLSHMKTTTVRELRNNYTQVLKWVAKGEEVEVTRRGRIVARVVPPPQVKAARVDWAQSAALNRPAWSRVLSADESAAIRAEGQGF